MRITSTEKKENWTTVGINYAGSAFSISIPFTDPASIDNALHCVGGNAPAATPAGTDPNPPGPPRSDRDAVGAEKRHQPLLRHQ